MPMSLFAIPLVLHASSDRSADQRAFERLVVSNGRAERSADQSASSLTVVMRLANFSPGANHSSMGSRESSFSGKQERQAQHCRLDSLRYHIGPPAVICSEMDAYSR
jgi:hypothetical protein